MVVVVCLARDPLSVFPDGIESVFGDSLGQPYVKRVGLLKHLSPVRWCAYASFVVMEAQVNSLSIASV